MERNGERLAAGVRECRGHQLKAFVNFKTTANEVILVKVGISGTGIEGARKNLAAEIPGWNFDAVRCGRRQAVGKCVRRRPDQDIRSRTFAKHFYANLYLSCLAPVLFNDVDGTYRGNDHQNHAGTNFQNYTTFSIWDIYRAEWPLLTLLQPNRINDMVQSMLAEYRELGQHTTPIWPLWGNETWCMIGYHSVDMIADAYHERLSRFRRRRSLSSHA